MALGEKKKLHLTISHVGASPFHFGDKETESCSSLSGGKASCWVSNQRLQDLEDAFHVEYKGRVSHGPGKSKPERR